MSPYKTHLSLAVVLAMTAFLPQRAQAQNWVNGQPAIFEIGQTGFNQNGQDDNYNGYNGTTGFFTPEFVVVDPATGKVFVSDPQQAGVLRFPSTAAMQNGAAAEAILGVDNLVNQGNSQPPTASTLVYPCGLAIDAAGNLWVADASDLRVVRYANAATIPSGTAASEVLGQPNFTDYISYVEAPTASSMSLPSGVFCSGTTLWVADENNFRILRFDNAASKANGAPADAVFSVPSFTYWALQNPLPVAANSLAWPNQLYVDAADNLWVADVTNNRVLMFPNASFAVNATNGGIGGPATLVLGQTNFTDNSPGTTASTMAYPDGVYGDAAGNLYVSEYLNNRILVFQNAASLSNGAAATYVLGQPNFTTNAAGDSADQLDYPYSVTIVPGTSGSSTVLMVVEEGNYRVSIWTPPSILPLLATSFTGQLQPDGQALLQWQVSDEGGTGVAGYTQLEYATHDTSGFTDVLNQQSLYPAIQNYSYLQVSPAPGANYYRLKLVAPDGSATYSQVVTITVSGGATGGTGLSIYPNPASSSLVVTLPQAGGSTAGAAMIEIYNPAGSLLQKLTTTSTVNRLSVAGWAAGVYTVRVVQGGHATSGSFVKMN
jgi:sugar lactone lactonase YvrE